MWIYEKKLQYPVKIKKPDPKAAAIIISQLGGADGKMIGHRDGFLSGFLFGGGGRCSFLAISGNESCPQLR